MMQVVGSIAFGEIPLCHVAKGGGCSHTLSFLCGKIRGECIILGALAAGREEEEPDYGTDRGSKGNILL